VHLPGSDLVTLDQAWLGKEGAHVGDEGFGDLGWQF
jgi:hypothetical protein